MATCNAKMARLSKVPRTPKFQIRNQMKRAKAELSRLRANVAQESSGKMGFNFTPTYQAGAFNFNVPNPKDEAPVVSEPTLKRDYDTAEGAKKETTELKTLTIINKSLASQSIISAAATDDMELLTEQVAKAKASATYCKKRLATELNCALMQAVTGKYVTMVRALLDWGADLTAFKSWYPVCLSAVDVNCEEIVDILIEKGVDFSATCHYGTPLHSAAKHGNVNILKKILALGVNDVNSKNYIQGATPLHTATLMKRKEAMELLLLSGADVNATDDSQRTALHHAAMHGAEELVEMLLAAGADLHAADSDNRTAWMHASVAMHTKLADKIINMNDNIKDLVFKDGASYLHLAAAAGLTSCCEYLLGEGHDIAAKDTNGNTPLMSAVSTNRLNIVRFLLAKDFLGAEIDHRNNDNESALVSSMKQDYTCLTAMTWKLLVDAGADIDVICTDGHTLLMQHLSQDDVSINKVEWLIKHGASLNHVTEKGDTALMMAVNCGQPKVRVIELLLEHNIDLRTSSVVSEKEGVTPLVAVLKQADTEAAGLLFHAGASLNGAGKWLKTEDAKRYADNDNELKDLCNAIQEKLPNSINLQEMARQAVLASLGHSKVTEKIQLLELPTMVKAYMDLDNYRKFSQFEYSHCD